MSGKVHSRSSQLSKSLDEVLHDKDALAYFISFLQSLSADDLVRFWLDVEAFRLAANRTHPADHIRPSEPIRFTTDCTSSIRLAAEQAPPTSICPQVEKTGVPDDQACQKTPEVSQQRAPTNYCGHASSSVNNSPKSVGRLPAHGEGTVCSTDASALSSPVVASVVGAAISPYEHCLTGSPQQHEQLQTVPSSSELHRPPVDSCSASTPSLTTPTQVMFLCSITIGSSLELHSFHYQYLQNIVSTADFALHICSSCF